MDSIPLFILFFRPPAKSTAQARFLGAWRSKDKASRIRVDAVQFLKRQESVHSDELDINNYYIEPYEVDIE